MGYPEKNDITPNELNGFTTGPNVAAFEADEVRQRSRDRLALLRAKIEGLYEQIRFLRDAQSSLDERARKFSVFLKRAENLFKEGHDVPDYVTVLEKHFAAEQTKTDQGVIK